MGWKKKQASEVEVEVTEPEMPAEKPVPFWKKEISLKRRPKDEGAAEQAAQPPVRDSGPGEGARGNREVPSTTEAAAGDADEQKPKPSIWKRELSIGRKRKAVEDEAASDEVEPAVEEDSWRRDLLFGSAEREAAPAPAGETTEDVEPEPEPQPEPLPEPVFFELPPDDDSGADPEPEPDVAAEADDAPDPVSVEDRPSWAGPSVSSVSSAYGWLSDDLAPADLASTSWAGTQPPAPIIPAPAKPEPEEPAVEAVEPEPVLEAEPEVVVEDEPEPIEPPRLETLPLPLPRAEIHPPVSAAELPPLPDESEEKQKKPSFLKRDLSFRRQRASKAERGAVEEAIVAAVDDAGDADEEPAEKKSGLKREISFRRKPKPQATEEKQPKQSKPRRRGKELATEPVAELADAPEEPKPAKEKTRRGKGAKTAGGGRHKKLVGLKIGASQLAAARIHNNGSAQLLQLAREDLEPGVVVGGELRDPEALSLALKAFFKKHKLPKTGVRLGIANNRIGVRTFDLAGIEDPKQLANAIRFRAQEALPIPIEEAVLDYRVLGETAGEDGGTSRRILLVVAYRDLVDRYVEACRKAGIKLVGIDLEAFALLRALSPPADEGVIAEAATVAVAIGHERSTFAVSDGRVCEFTRVLEWGGSSLNVAIARALDLSPSEAEPIKRELSLAAETDVEGMDADQVAQAREAVMRQVQSFARELVSSLQFYQGQPGSLGIAEIAITGGTAHLPGLAAELERMIGVRVRVADPLARVRVGKKVSDADQVGSLAVAIGLGIDD